MIEWVVLVVILCSVIQSVFGVGILLFGTPTLLLMGLGFTESLGYLLPASIAISALQLRGGRKPARGLSPDLWRYCVPMIGIGLALTLFGAGGLPIRKIVGFILILSVVAIAARPARAFLMQAVERHSALYHSVMGLVHGLSNMGGAMLAVYAAGAGGDREQTRYLAAHYYLVFGLCQLAALAVTGRLELSYNLATPVLSVGIYLLLGNRIFKTASEPVYKALFTAFMAFYGAVLLVA